MSASIVFILSTSFSAAFGSEPEKSTIKTQNGFSTHLRSADYFHPVLKSKAGEGFSGAVTGKMLRKLNRLNTDKSVIEMYSRGIKNPTSWGDFFSIAERDACEKFCQLAKSMNKSQVINSAGEPTLRLDLIDMSSNCKGGKDLWVYNLGGSWIPIVIEFENQKVVNAFICDYEQYWSYVEYVNDDFLLFCPGKTRSQIVSRYGQPEKEFLAKFRSEKTQKEATPKILEYSTSNSTFIEITLEQNLCKAVKMMPIAH